MKRLLVVLLALTVAISLAACGDTTQIETSIPEPTATPEPTPTPTPEPKETGWFLNYLLDDFGDQTDEAYLQNLAPGTLDSPSATEQNIYASLSFYPTQGEDNWSALGVRFYDSTIDSPLKTPDSDEKVVKVKIGDEIIEDTLIEVASGDLFLGNGMCLLGIHKALLENDQPIRFIVEAGTSKFTFSAGGGDYSECLNEYWTLYPDRTFGLYYEKTAFPRAENFLPNGADDFPSVIKTDFEEVPLGDAGVYLSYTFSFLPYIPLSNAVNPFSDIEAYLWKYCEKSSISTDLFRETIALGGLEFEDVWKSQLEVDASFAHVDSLGNTILIWDVAMSMSKNMEEVKDAYGKIIIIYA